MLSWLSDPGKMKWNMPEKWFDGYDVDLFCIRSGLSGEENTHFIIRLTKEGCMGNYLSGEGSTPEERFVAMARIDYKSAAPRYVPSYIFMLRDKAKTALAEGKKAVFFLSEIEEPDKYHNPKWIKPTTAEVFFAVHLNPKSEHPGDTSFLEDRDFILQGKPPVKKILTFSAYLQTPRGMRGKLTEKILEQVDFSEAAGMTNMNALFAGLSGVERLDLSALDTKGVTSMAVMFENCARLRRLDLSGFDTSAVTHMGYMFSGCANLTDLNLSGFSFGKVRDMANMFKGCEKLRRVILPGSILTAGSVRHDTGRTREQMFWNCADAHTPSQADHAGALRYAFVPVYENVSFGEATDAERREYLGLGPNVELLIDDGVSFQRKSVPAPAKKEGVKPAKEEKMQVYGYPTQGERLRKLSDFGKSGEGKGTYDDYDADMFFIRTAGSEESEYFVIRMTKAGCMGNYLVGNGKNLADRFVAMVLVERKTAIHSLTQYRYKLRKMMQACIEEGKADVCFFFSRTEKHESRLIPDPFERISAEKFFGINVDPASEYRGDIEYLMDRAFFLGGQRPAPKRPTLATLRQMLPEERKQLTSEGFSRIDLSASVGMADMSNLFAGLSCVEQMDLTALKTDRAIRMDMMFGNCMSLKKLDLSGFRTPSVKNMNYMFAGCESLAELDLSGFNFWNVADMAHMFKGCTKLRKVILPGSILVAGSVRHDTGRTRREWYSGWGGAHSPSQADFAGTSGYEDVPVYERVAFGDATKKEQQEYLGLGPNVKIEIV